MNTMDVHRNMEGVTNKPEKAVEKLSFGMKINSEGDDYVGLTISKRIRS